MLTEVVRSDLQDEDIRFEGDDVRRIEKGDVGHRPLGIAVEMEKVVGVETKIAVQAIGRVIRQVVLQG